LNQSNFTGAKEIEEKDVEIFQFISDERILRVLFEQKIFKLREIQKEAIKKGLFFHKSFLVCAPSGSGKTLIGEVCALNNIFQGFGKSVYLVPFKALATEKYVHFKKRYERFGVKVELSIGDYDIDDSKLEQADLIVTTYEKMDSILRNFFDKDWIFQISTVIIDEVHIIGEESRGPRLESLIVRLNEFLRNPQLIGLSATIANPEFFNSWLSSLGNATTLLFSDQRPVPLHYKLEITQNKDSTIKKIVKSTLENNGQVLIFLSKRKATHQIAQNLKNLVRMQVEKSDLKACKELEIKLKAIKGGHSELRKVVKNAIAFHHAGLLPRERKFVEDAYRKRKIKVICATTTLSAGINMPARVVILRDFKKFVTSGHNIKDFNGFHETGDGFSFFLPFSANEVFQMLGRAGRPGLDKVGYGIILVKNLEELNWVEGHYFNGNFGSNFTPKYNDLTSGLNKTNTLKEQVLLRIYEEGRLSLDKLKSFFEKTYFWYGIQNKIREQKIPIEQLLLIDEIAPLNILKLHADPEKINRLRVTRHQIKITKITSTSISGYVKTNFGVFYCEFDVEMGIRCTCGFENGISNPYSKGQFTFSFCDHITAFLLHIINVPDPNFAKYVGDIVPKSIRHQYILDYLLEKGLIRKDKEGKFVCTTFGKLIIRLYLYPVSGVLIRYKLERCEMNSSRDIVNEAYDVLKAEGKVKDERMLSPLLDWADEIPIDDILTNYKIMTGDLYALRDNLERVITFIGIIAIHLSEHDTAIQEKMINITEFCETLKIRVHYGIREELFDLVLRLENVARVRARILFDAGYRTATQVRKENPFVLSRKTGFGVNLCKKIVGKNSKKKL
jgi:replicative superfamily II helicase